MRIAFAVAAALVTVSALAAAKDEPQGPLVLEPSSEWHLNYADDSCRILRTFGEGDSKSVLYLERYEPGDRFFMVVAGELFDARARDAIRYEFGPNGAVQEAEARTGEFGKHGPALMLGNMSLLPLPDDRDHYEFREDDDPAMWMREANVFGQVLSAEQEEGITWLQVQHKRNRPVRLALGSMKPAMTAMRKCTDELMRHWNLDLDAHRTMSRLAAPASNPGDWIRSRDYPVGMLKRGAQGLVQFRLAVGADGQTTACHIQQSTRPAEFDRAVCQALMRRARFVPALDANGQPMASYWRSAVRFEMAR